MTKPGYILKEEEYDQLIMGRQPVMEALRRGGVKRLFLMEGQKGKPVDTIRFLAGSTGVPCTLLSRAELNRMLRGNGNHQGVVAVGKPFLYLSLDQLVEDSALCSGHPLLVMLDHLEDPQNFGSIIRTADAAGVHGIIIPKDRSVSITPSVRKVAAGAVERIRVARVANLVRAIEFLKSEGFWIYGSDAGGEFPFYRADYEASVVLVIGSEGRGLSPLVRRHCDRILSIPMTGEAGSLNAAVAAALLIFGAVGRREGWGM